MPSHPQQIVVPLPVRDPFDRAAWQAYVASRSIPAIEHVDGERYVRSVAVDHRATVIAVRAAEAQRLELAIDAAFAEHVDALTALARAALSLDPHDAGPDARAALATDRDLAPLLVSRPHLRVPGTWDPFETGVRAIVGQQVSVAGATTVTARIVHRHGTPVVTRADAAPTAPSITHAFPRPEALAHGDLAGLGLTNARMATIRAFATAVADGAIRLAVDTPLDELVASIVAQRGLGP